LQARPVGHEQMRIATSGAALCISLLICAALTACRSAREVRLVDVDKLACELEAGGQKLFFPSAKCMEALPQKAMRGYWMTGREYSVFYFNKEEATTDYDETATWLSLSQKAEDYLSSESILPYGTLFEISFVGTYSDTPGLYDVSRRRKSQVHVVKFESIEELIRLPIPTREEMLRR
jgi:hypothetical protein